MNTELAIIKQENILQIVSAAPQAYASNTTSHDKCIEAGQHLLSLIEQNGGKLTDELDQQAAVYIEKARKTVKKMNEVRAPVTKLFDEVRTAFTRIENNIDPTKPNTIPAKLQQLRNSYAAQKRAEEEARQRQEAARQMAERERQQYMLDVEVDLKKQFQCMLNQHLDQLRQTHTNPTGRRMARQSANKYSFATSTQHHRGAKHRKEHTAETISAVQGRIYQYHVRTANLHSRPPAI